MKTEAELRELHTRLVQILVYAKATKVPFKALFELIGLKVGLEYILDMNTAAARDWQAAVFKAINNLEALRKAAERSREAASN